MLGLHCSEGFSLAVESGSFSLLAMWGLLIAVAAPVAKHRLSSHGLQQVRQWAQQLQFLGSRAEAHSCST